ncbi:mechanosensitive ion channel domain-containing protein [Rhodovulum sp. YEN HP10]|uniref:mechanosensitive ion channel domain-containing protein n=1 Tax=Rhodovulum sp. HP10 TaxID=3387397 RepID=UPI0039E08B41
MNRFFSRLLPLLLAALFLSPLPALAQGAPATPEAPGAEARALIDILRDDSAREALIAELEQAAGRGSADQEEAAAPPSGAAAPGIGRQVAEATSAAVEDIAARLAAGWAALGRAGQAFDGLDGGTFEAFVAAMRNLLAIVVATVLVQFALRLAVRPLHRRLGRKADGQGPLRRLVSAGLAALLDLGALLLAWASGYALTAAAIGSAGTVGLTQSLYLNAFLVVGVVRLAFAILFAPGAPPLRLLPVSDAGAKRTVALGMTIAGLLAYGHLLAVPVVARDVSALAAASLGVLITVLALLSLGAFAILYRRPVAHWMLTRLAPPLPSAAETEESPEVWSAPPPEAQTEAQTDTQAIAQTNARTNAQSEPGTAPGAGAGSVPRRHGRLALALAQNWHWAALAYLAVLAAIVLTGPAGVVLAALAGSARLLAALLLAGVVSAALARAAAHGVQLPERLSDRLPLLEPRLNRVIPVAMVALRYLIVLAVALFALDTLGVLAVRSWMESQFGLRMTAALSAVLLILAVAYGLWLAMTSWVDYRLAPASGRSATPREATLLSLLRNALTIVIAVLAAMFCLSEIGLDIGPLLASAGVLGLAIGFGAQKLVQDVITGVFIQLENAMNVGDVVSLGGTTGTVEKLTIRSVSLRDVSGTYHIIPFSSVDMVSNLTRDFSYYVCDMGVAYREDVDEVKTAMEDAFAELGRDPEARAAIRGDLEWFGLNSFGDSAVVVRARIRTLPGKQWGIGRAYNGILKRLFDERNIEIPFPHQTITFAEAKDGRTQPVRVINGAAQEAE